MRANSYEDKLKNPLWQRKRLEKMDQAGWKCEVCCDMNEELHVHHREYLGGLEPWSYTLEELECLCSTCHKLRHMPKEKLKTFAQAAGLNIENRDSLRLRYTHKRLFDICDTEGMYELHKLIHRWGLELEAITARFDAEVAQITTASNNRKTSQDAEAQPTTPSVCEEPSTVSTPRSEETEQSLLWTEFLARIRKDRPLILSWVQSGSFLGLENGIATIEFKPSDDIARDGCNRPNNRALMESILSETAGAPITIRCERLALA